MEQQRLDKLLAATGAYSRKEAKERIRKGRVLVNGIPFKSGALPVDYGAIVTVDGVPIRNQKHLYIMMNKPQGVLCATRDDHCPTVLDLLPPELRRKGLFPAGRLDKDTEGFVLITDDGDFAHRVLSPRRGVPKTYEAVLNAPFDVEAVAAAFAAGLAIDGGDVCAPASLSLLEDGPRPLAQVVICEGMYHQVKRMFAVFSLQVLALRRVKIGDLPLDPNLASGEAKEIITKDIVRIERSFGVSCI